MEQTEQNAFDELPLVAAVLAPIDSTPPAGIADDTQNATGAKAGDSTADNTASHSATANERRRTLQLLYRWVLWVLWASLALVVLIGGWWVRTYAWEQTESIRFTSDINNAFRIGTDALGIGFLDYYDHCDRLSEQGDAFDVNYAPARLLIATQWARWVAPRLNAPDAPTFLSDRFFYERARLLRQTYKLCSPLLLLNTIMELLAAAGMFVLMRHWTRGRWRPATANLLATLAATALWLNPALIWDAHCWPQWDAWLLPFLVWAMVAASGGYWFLTGVLIALGAMFKGQMLLGAPVLLLWPLWQGKWSAVLREIIGFFGGVALCTSVWLLRRNGAVIGTALLWVLGIALAMGLVLLQRRSSNWLMKIAAIIACAGLLLWPMFTMGATAIGCGLLAAAPIIVAAVLLQARSQGYVATACLSAALFLCAPLFGGSTAWFNIGIVSGMHMAPVLHSGSTCNLPAILESQWGWSEMDVVVTVPAGGIANALGAAMAAIDQHFTYTPNFPVGVPLKHLLLASYFVALILCGLGAAIQDRHKNPKILLALMAPWVLMFSLLPQMHERYLVWGASLSAVMIAISPGYFMVGLLITAIAWSQQAMVMMIRAEQPDSALLRFMNGWTPGVGWALLVVSLFFVFETLVPERVPKLGQEMTSKPHDA